MAELTEVLKAAVAKGASDVHLAVGRPPMMRVSGEMAPIDGAAPLTADSAKEMIYAILFEDQRARFEADWELDCSLAVPGVSRFRVNVFQQKRGIGAALRVIPGHIPTPQEIGLPPSVTALTAEPRGLVLVTGPTGSGKSTTLASLVEVINSTRRKTILTIEDPVEFVYEDKNSVIFQREVGQQTKSFAEALRHAMRQNPDVILIGEMRDLETISLAITAAETGHLCLATLHTHDAPTTVDRIIDVFPPHQQQQVRIQVSTVLKAVVSQVLLPRKDGKGRVAAREIMTNTPAVGNIIREGKTHMLYGAIESGAKFGMVSMDQYLAFLVKSNVVNLEDALTKAHDPEALKALLTLGRAAA
ncbi:MAG TPA: type IV pilus twitching motility protein PilT [Elusimicrobiota bacterium]|jgi:twitching motility protein PilT|nr:type IV pilus twitching motility protein PilT [Elusimicrobiota bacterium]